MKYSKDWLEKELTENKEIEYLFFCGHQPSKDGSIIKRCMSQWWPVNLKEENIIYKTAEHYMMAGKAKLINYDDTKPMNTVNIWNTDTGAGFTGKLSMLDADTKDFWQSDCTNIILMKWVEININYNQSTK